MSGRHVEGAVPDNGCWTPFLYCLSEGWMLWSGTEATSWMDACRKLLLVHCVWEPGAQNGEKENTCTCQALDEWLLQIKLNGWLLKFGYVLLFPFLPTKSWGVAWGQCLPLVAHTLLQYIVRLGGGGGGGVNPYDPVHGHHVHNKLLNLFGNNQQGDGSDLLPLPWKQISFGWSLGYLDFADCWMSGQGC